jgi:hypothetical protein
VRTFPSRLSRPAAALALAGALTGAAPASAEDAGKWEVTAFAGGFFGNRVSLSDTLEVRLATAPTCGLRLGTFVTRTFLLEAGWSYAPSRLLLLDPVRGQSLGPSTPVRVNTYEVDALFWFGRSRIRGYVGLGGGVMHLNPTVEPIDRASSAQFEADFALGGSFSLGPRVALRADARYRWRGGKTHVGAIVCYPYGCEPFTTNIFSSAEVTGGLAYRF